jgi:hypothetical protein
MRRMNKMSKQQVLIETLNPNEAKIQESKQNGQHWYLEGIFMQSEKKNGNGRVYPKKVLEEAVNQINSKIDKGFNVLGELEHPDVLNINLNNVSHVIEKLEWRGNDVIGKAKILDTPKGEIVKALLKEGIKLGVSSRGSGSTRREGDKILIESFNLVTVDIVATPSAPDAFPQSLKESVEVIYNDPKIKPLSEAVLEDKAAQKYFEKEIKKFLENIINKIK